MSWAATCSALSEAAGMASSGDGGETSRHIKRRCSSSPTIHEPIEMNGGTTFHFVTEGFDAALERATAAADGLGVDMAGGASTVPARRSPQA